MIKNFLYVVFTICFVATSCTHNAPQENYEKWSYMFEHYKDFENDTFEIEIYPFDEKLVYEEVEEFVTYRFCWQPCNSKEAMKSAYAINVTKPGKFDQADGKSSYIVKAKINPVCYIHELCTHSLRLYFDEIE